jgi:hypothetical protein
MSLQQPCAQLTLERMNVRGDGWRRQKEPPRGGRELSFLDHREKRLQMAKLHEHQITHRDERSSGA